jgi:hypothetical protein
VKDKSVVVLNRIILAVALVLSFALHQAMQCQAVGAVSAASDRCSHEQSCPHSSAPASPVKGCCVNSACLSNAQCVGVDERVGQANVAQFQPVSAGAFILQSSLTAHFSRVALRFHSPPAQVPLFLIHHAFLI